MVVKLLEIKNRSYYFWDDTIFLKDFNAALLKLDKESSIGIDVYYVGYVTKKSVFSINSVNPLYLVIREMDGYVEEIDDSDDIYLNIALTNNNTEVINKFNEVWKGIKDQILKIDGSVKEYDKDYKKIRFNSDVALPLNTVLKLYSLAVIIRCIIDKKGKYYPQIYLDDALFEL